MNRYRNLTLVDDDELFVYLTKRSIKQIDEVAQVKIFKNGLEAIKFIQSNKDQIDQLPELILLDLSMPIMDGWQFLDAFSNLNLNLPYKIIIYIVSSSISPHDIERAKKINEVSDYIVKPIGKDKLMEILSVIWMDCILI